MIETKLRPPTTDEAKAWLLKMTAYPKYQNQCLRFWYYEFNLDYRHLMDQLVKK